MDGVSADNIRPDLEMSSVARFHIIQINVRDTSVQYTVQRSFIHSIPYMGLQDQSLYCGCNMMHIL